jgi:membrane peptidoglycan carboxypeptidase
LIVYTPAFEGDYTPNSIVEDQYFEGGPKNSDKTYLGKIKLQKAIEKSKNTIAWKLFQEITPQTGLAYLLNMNFSKIKDKDYTLASSLGGLTVGVSPVEMASAYSALENDGYYREPTCIVKIMDSEGNEIVSAAAETKQIYQTNAARIMTEALTGVIKNGTGKGLGLTNTISAGKTGTTNDKKDGWFVGYTPYYTTSVWVGYDLPKSVDNLTGATFPGTIWHNFMEQLHTTSMNAKFEYYDWRTALKAKEDQEKLQEEAAAQEEAGDTTKDTDPNSTEDLGSDSEGGIQEDPNGLTEENPGADDGLDDAGSADTGEDSQEDGIDTENPDGTDVGSGNSGTDTTEEGNGGAAEEGNTGEDNTNGGIPGDTTGDNGTVIE